MVTAETFINNFKKGFDKDYLEHVFTDGNCYHFSLIIQGMYGGDIVYDPHEFHFLTKIDNEFFDITGKVDEPMDYYYWNELEDIDYTEYTLVQHNCIYKI